MCSSKTKFSLGRERGIARPELGGGGCRMRREETIRVAVCFPCRQNTERRAPTRHRWFTRSSIVGHWGCSLLVSGLNSDVGNTCVFVRISIFTSFGYVPGSGIDR